MYLDLYSSTKRVERFCQFPHKQHQPVPDHQEVEADEEAEDAAAVRHQGAEGEGLLLPEHLHRGRGEYDGAQHRHIIWLDNFGFLHHLVLNNI